jgi:ubiquinone biosynthesis protein
LYPELDLWQTAKPFLEDWFHERLGPKAKIKQALKRFPELAESFPEIPTLLFQALDSAAKMNQQFTTHNRELAELRQNIEDNHNTTLVIITAASLLISLAVLLQ